MKTPLKRGLIPCKAPQRLAQVGAAALTHFASRLDLVTEPGLCWFFEARNTEHGPSTEPTMSGCTILGSNEIWLSISQDELEVWRTVAHELGHVAGMNEGRANAYERLPQVAQSFRTWHAATTGAA